MTDNDISRLRGLLGLSRRGGMLTVGTESVCLSMAGKSPPCLVLLSAGASDATKKKLHTKCAYYGVPIREIPLSPADLGHTVGKTTTPAVVAVTDEHMAKELFRLCGTVPSQRKDDTE